MEIRHRLERTQAEATYQFVGLVNQDKGRLGAERRVSEARVQCASQGVQTDGQGMRIDQLAALTIASK